MFTQRQPVHRIEDGMDRRDVLCTTYQQRNFFTQLRDGYFTRNDTFNYMLHHQVARWASRRKGAHVLDVCCGRGLHLPMLRYHAKELGSYTGLDIKRTNATWLHQRVTDGKPYHELQGASAATAEAARASYYPWPTYFLEGNVAEADKLVVAQHDTPAGALDGRPLAFDLIIYTASIEHMHPEDGQRSLHALRELARPGTTMVLTCPNTPEHQDGYDTRYRAHVYEWKLSELREGLAEAGWHVHDEWGADIGVTDLQEAMDEDGHGNMLRRLREFVPQEWLVPALAPLYPVRSSEVGLLCGTEPGGAGQPLEGQASLFDGA